MLTYLNFEQKIIRNSFPKITLLIILGMIAALFFINMQKAKEEAQNLEEIYHFSQADFDRHVNVTETLDSYLSQGFTEEEYERDQKDSHEFAKTRLAVSSSINNKDYQAYYKYQLENLQTFEIEGFLDEEMEDGIFYGSEAVFSEYRFGQKKFYGQLSKRRLKLETPRYGISDWLFTLSSLKVTTSVIGSFLFLIVCAYIHFEKYEEKHSRLIMTLPISKIGILISDTILFFFQSLALLAFILFTCFILASFFGDRVPLDYPIIVRGAEKLTLIPAFQVVLMISGLFLLVVNLLYQLSTTAMILFKKVFLATLISSLLLLLLSVFFQKTNIILEDFSAFNPFSYTSPYDLFVGSSYEAVAHIQHNHSSLTYSNVDYYSGLTLVAGNKDLSLAKGICSLCISILALFTINNFLIRRVKF